MIGLGSDNKHMIGVLVHFCTVVPPAISVEFLYPLSGSDLPNTSSNHRHKVHRVIDSSFQILSHQSQFWQIVAKSATPQLIGAILIKL